MPGIPDDLQALRIGTTDVVAVTTASATSAVVNSAIVRIAVIGADVHFAIGATPTATTNNALLPTGAVEYLRVNSGVDKFAFLAVTGSGTASVSDAD